MVPDGCRSRCVCIAPAAAEQDSEAAPLPEFLAEDEDQESVSDDDRPQLDAAE
jgi:ParB family chromosome partitioning protein